VRRPKAEVVPLVEHSAARPGDTARVALKVSLPEGLHTQSNKPRDPLLIPTELTIDAPSGVTVTEVVFPPSTDLKQAGQDQPLAVFEQTFGIGVQLAIAASAPPGKIVVPLHLRYQACDANLCYAPSTADAEWTLDVAAGKTGGGTPDPIFATIAFGKGEAPGTAAAPAARAPAAPASGDGIATLDQFTTLGMNGGYLNADEFLRFVHNAENGVKERGMFEGRGPLMILLLVLVGGLALNLTPCVLPMIPINLAIIGAGAQAGSRGRGFMLGSAYGLAMALVYGAIGLVVILTAGTFGTINSSPWFNLGIAILFVVLALAMFDVLLIDFSTYAGNLGMSSSRGSFALAFSMGGVAALLAGACVAPVVIQVVLFSSNLYATGTKLALALPRHRHGDSVADRGRRSGGAAEAGHVDGPRQAGVRRLHHGDGSVLRLRGVLDLREPLGGSGRGRVQRAGSAEGRLARLARRRARSRTARAEAGPDRHVGHLVQELPDHGQDDARERGCPEGAVGLRADQISGGRPRPAAGQDRDAALQRRRPSHLRHPTADQVRSSADCADFGIETRDRGAGGVGR
jgi:cytochrome c biogenesis protein CcdA